MTFAVFVLSTGRCGTQWLAAAMKEDYSDLITADHEPTRGRYEPRKALSLFRHRGDPPALPTELLAHCRWVKEQLNTRTYIECGHLVWSTIPWLIDQFQGRVRIVHLTRHPVTTCCSWLTHGAFQPPVLPHIPEKVLLSPFDEGIRFAEFRETWDKITPYEKCLFYWSEVHAYALELQTKVEIPWLQLRYEDLFFEGDGLERLLKFLELPQRDSVFGRRTALVDNWRFLSNSWNEWQIVEQYPQVKEITRQLGYQLNGIQDSALRRRYLATPDLTSEGFLTPVRFDCVDHPPASPTA